LPHERIGEEYLSNAINFGAAQGDRDFEAGNDFATNLERLGKLLRESPEGQQLLRDLLTHQDPYVRVWAAKDSLPFAAELGVPVLEAIEATKGLLGTAARMTLSEWRAGRLFRNS
jgi:hypothetical protein